MGIDRRLKATDKFIAAFGTAMKMAMLAIVTIIDSVVASKSTIFEKQLLTAVTAHRFVFGNDCFVVVRILGNLRIHD